MRIGITVKLFLILALASFLIVGSMVAIMQRSFDRGFLRYVNTVEEAARVAFVSELELRHANGEEWPTELRTHWREIRIRSYAAARADTERAPRLPAGAEPVITDTGKQPVTPIRDRQFQPDSYDFRALRNSGQLIGYVGFPNSNVPSDVRDLRFLEQQTRTFLIIAVLTAVVCAVLALPFSRQLVRPVKRLSTTVRSLAAGQYDVRINDQTPDEVGQLSRDLNFLAQALEKNERDRQQWVADVAHELRTPLAVMLANIEAIQDGIRQSDTDEINSLHTQTKHLARLVDDLHELSMADIGALNYRMELLSAPELLRDTLSTVRHSFDTAGLRIEEQIAQDDIRILGDANRLQQLFDNLLANTLAYTDRGGTLRIIAQRQGDRVYIDFQDSPPGVPDEALPRLFERLYRVDAARTRGSGGTGLGLAICASIVEAHGGRISARQSPLGGVWIRVDLPALA